MKRLLTSATILCFAAGSLISATAQAAPHHGWHDHSDWHKGGYVSHDDWNHGRQIDYRRYHLRRPPRGYEWREVNGNYVMVAVATGLIASLILNHH
jgi:Ni/Co efflux regulator RcnB